MKHISSRDNPRFKHLRALNDDSRYRRQSGTTLIDGDHLLTAALDAGWRLSCVMFREDVTDTLQAQRLRLRLAVEAPDCELLVLAPALFNALSPVVSPAGYLAEIEIPQPPTVCDENHDVLAIAGVQDAGNLGTLLRTAAAAGVHQVWLDRQTTHAWSPKALRAGMGAQFQLSIRESCELKPLLVGRKQAIRVTSLAEGACSLYSVPLLQPGVWVFGAEGQGVPSDLLEMATQHVVIPMPGRIESLNVAAAAAVCLFEQLRQRQFS